MQALPEPQLLTGRLGLSTTLAVLLHGGLLLLAWLSPPPPVKPRTRVIQMEVVARKPETPTPPPPQPPPPPAEPTDRSKDTPQDPRPARPLPSLLEPVKRTTTTPEPQSPAITLPEQPKAPPGVKPSGPVILFPKDLSGITPGAPGANTPVPKGTDRLIKDDRLDEKKGPEFVLAPEKGGGFKYDGKRFSAHIAPDGSLKFDDAGPIGFAKGSSGFSFDLTDLAMRGRKQDPYGAEKRRFMEQTDKLRDDLRRKHVLGSKETHSAAVPHDLEEIWESQKPAAVRRRELFEYWEQASDDADPIAQQRGRRQTEAYIQKHLPPGSADAYTDEELRRFAAQRVGQPAFQPYGPR